MNAQNVLINIKKGRSAKWPFDDPNYIPRVEHRVVSKTKEMKDGSTKTIERVKIIHNIPLSGLDRKTLEDMGRLPHQLIRGYPNPNNVSNRKHPRIVNNSPKYINRRNRHNPDKVSRVQVRAIPIKRFTKEFIKLVKEGTNPKELMHEGKISRRYIRTTLKTTKQSIDKTYGFNRPKVKKNKNLG